MRGRPLAIAHRGDPYACRENTLDAYAAAARAGADMVEIDLRLTADGAVVCLHDATFERLWGDPRRCADVAGVDVPAGIPTFAETLAAVELPLMVDYVDEDVAEPALEQVLAAGALDRCLFSGENVAGHRRLRALEPAARIALTWTRSAPPPGALLDELRPEYLNPPWELLDPAYVEAARGRGIGLSTWTVDADDAIEQVLAVGADAIVTNRIGALVERLAAEPARC